MTGIASGSGRRLLPLGVVVASLGASPGGALETPRFSRPPTASAVLAAGALLSALTMALGG